MDDTQGLILPTQNWHLAKCYLCNIEIPFRNTEERDTWAEGHSTTGHTVWVVDMENDHIIRLEAVHASTE